MEKRVDRERAGRARLAQGREFPVTPLPLCLLHLVTPPSVYRILDYVTDRHVRLTAIHSFSSV